MRNVKGVYIETENEIKKRKMASGHLVEVVRSCYSMPFYEQFFV